MTLTNPDIEIIVKAYKRLFLKGYCNNTYIIFPFHLATCSYVRFLVLRNTFFDRCKKNIMYVTKNFECRYGGF